MGTTLEQIVVEPRRLADPHLVRQRRRVGTDRAGISATHGSDRIDAACNLMPDSPVTARSPMTTLEMSFF